MDCILCKDRAIKPLPLCQTCKRELPWHPKYNIGFYYKPPISHWITQLKFHHQLFFAKTLGHLISEKLKRQRNLPEIIIPIPLHTRRLCKRGFNQSLEIAKVISKQLNIPIDLKILKRIRYTKPQSELTEKERINNLCDAFSCCQKNNDKFIAIFDDVITTGTTVNAAYKTLKEKGFKQVEIWSCAKTSSRVSQTKRQSLHKISKDQAKIQQTSQHNKHCDFERKEHGARKSLKKVLLKHLLTKLTKRGS